MSLPTSTGLDTLLDGLPLAQAFYEFDCLNPGFYPLLVRYSREAQAAGKDKYAIGSIISRARWSLEVETVTPDDQPSLKVNNDTAAFYARLIMLNEPDLEGFFNTRSTKESQPDEFIRRLTDYRKGYEAR